MKYLDKTGKKIKANQIICIGDNDINYVFKTYSSSLEEDTLGVLASNIAFIRNHPDWEPEFYPLYMFSASDISIIQENPDIRYEKTRVYKIADWNAFIPAFASVLRASDVSRYISIEPVNILDGLVLDAQSRQISYDADTPNPVAVQIITRLMYDYKVIRAD